MKRRRNKSLKQECAKINRERHHRIWNSPLRKLAEESYINAGKAQAEEVQRKRRLGLAMGIVIGFVGTGVFVVAIGVPLAILYGIFKGILWLIRAMVS